MLREVASCVGAEWRTKAVWSVLLTLFFCVPYFALQRAIVMPVHTFPLSWVDEAVTFDPRWASVYQSGYLLLSVVPWLLDRPEDLSRYVRGFVRISLVGFAFFVLLPVAGPRPADAPAAGMYGWLVSYDRPTNAFPSLHMAFLGFTVLVAARVSRHRVPASRRRWLLASAAAWTVAVAYATLATKQHYAIDLPAGLLLAWLVDRRTR